MELTQVTTTPQASHALRIADSREVQITLVYGEDDIEAAAESLNVDLSVGERDSMLLLLDDAIGDVVRVGIRSALDERLREEVSALQTGRACTEDE